MAIDGSGEMDAGRQEEQETARLAEQAKRELAQIEAALAGITQHRLLSNWNQTVGLTEDDQSRGRKPFTCLIRLNRERQKQEVRWRTLIHEMLHAHSAGYVRTAYDALPGWEEGVVEQLQRLLRPSLLKQLGVQVAESVFLDKEQAHPYNEYIAALEAIRQQRRPGTEIAAEFYIDLLGVPIMDRPAWMMQQGKRLPVQQQALFFKVFARSNAVLRHPIRRYAATIMPELR